MSRTGERGAAVVDVVLVMIVLLPLVAGVLQLALVLYARNTAMAAASEGARYAAALGMTPADGAAHARAELRDLATGSFVRSVTADATTLDGAPAVAVTVNARVPALGLAGPAVSFSVTGHAVQEQP